MRVKLANVFLILLAPGQLYASVSEQMELRLLQKYTDVTERSVDVCKLVSIIGSLSKTAAQ